MPENASSTALTTDPVSPEFERRFPRRLLFAGAAAGVAALSLAGAPPAEAAPATTPWALGGNTGVSTNNFLGPTNAGAPLIFKTKNDAGSSLSEKMRLSAIGRLGLGVTDPKARLDAVGSTIAVQGTSTATTTAGRALSGIAKGGYGVFAKSDDTAGYCDGAYLGVYARGSVAMRGEGTGYGAFFSGGDTGLQADGAAFGVRAFGTTAVYASGSAQAVRAAGGQYGVLAENGGTASVRGVSPYVGVWGDGATYGVYGRATGTSGDNYGLFGSTASPTGYALYASGNARVTGTLSKSSGSFQIDHPLDPDNKWLSHSFVESPDMMNVYNGNVTTDAKGDATVTLPDYFEALNRDFRYQLTVIGGGFAQAVVSRKVARNSFELKTDKPGIEVSWQVTGIRHDSYAEAHPIVVETSKAPADTARRAAPVSPDGGPAADPIPPVPDAAVAPPRPTAPGPSASRTAP
ncbi:hypothetical protein [Herbiconiux flava]|uniref:Uncharacterized protein n=1 Tax=Herbiconiux flava TaxID=881268 RepID=A0A852SQH1_9MICO|nr:hypothetical protein [Herbiconiux flava]NYD71168.1 hypothetical protein [Herbiconiux flava]GLK18868.1 hypothetical protein GCM10017602_33500 [Herbiconiux flava]